MTGVPREAKLSGGSRLGFVDRPYLLLVVTTLFWGANAVAGRMAIGQVSPMVVTSLRWLVVVAVLGAVAHRQIVAEWDALKRHWRPILLMGTFGFTLFNGVFYEAAHYTSAVNIGIVQGAMPVIVLVGSYLAYRTPVRPLQCVGLVVTLAGVVVVVSRGDLAVLRHLDFNAGDLAMGAASILYGGYTVALKSRPPIRPLAFFLGVAIAAFLTSLPLMALEIALGGAFWPTPEGWALIVAIALFPSLVGQVMYLRGVELIGPGRAGLFINLVPIFAAILGVWVLGETFALYHAAALALVLGGIGVAEWGRG